MSDFALPFQTEFDPPEQAEGSLDPLGLYSIADALGVRLAAGVRERQSHPRYLTLALVGHLAVSAIEDTETKVAPWLVYEWLVVRSLVHELRDRNLSTDGIPGSLKVLQSLKGGLPVCNETYLKTPTVFGFHGIYRVLGLKAGLFDDEGRPLTSGFQVLTAWERDQGLAGFASEAAKGAGAGLRRMLQRVVQQGVAKREIADVPKELREFIVSHLHPLEPGNSERVALWRVLTQSDPMRREYSGLLTSAEGQRTWISCEGSESKFQRWARQHASVSLAALLAGIGAFESFARALFDAFEEIRWRMTSEGSAVDKDWLASGRAMASAHRKIKGLYDEALRSLAEVDPLLQRRTERSFDWVSECGNPASLATGILWHHEKTQKAKPPNGKRSWFDSFTDGRVAIRPGYLSDRDFAAAPTEFVHAYRTRPLWRFAQDLDVVQIAVEA